MERYRHRADVVGTEASRDLQVKMDEELLEFAFDGELQVGFATCSVTIE